MSYIASCYVVYCLLLWRILPPAMAYIASCYGVLHEARTDIAVWCRVMQHTPGPCQGCGASLSSTAQALLSSTSKNEPIYQSVALPQKYTLSYVKYMMRINVIQKDGAYSYATLVVI